MRIKIEKIGGSWGWVAKVNGRDPRWGLKREFWTASEITHGRTASDRGASGLSMI